MSKPWIFLLALAFAGAAHAQQFKWIDKDGKTRYGDNPPAGVKATALGAPASGAAPASPAAAAKDAKKGPLTTAEREQDFRNRQREAKKASEKSDEERLAQAARKDDCERAREYVRTLESGQRIARTDASGERYFLDENQVAQEIVKARQSAQQTCK
jgi:hypothetical protein